MTNQEIDFMNLYIKEVNSLFARITEGVPEDHQQKIFHALDQIGDIWNRCIMGIGGSLHDFEQSLNHWASLQIEAIDLAREARREKKRQTKLTLKQQKFVKAFVKYQNASKAARLSGYSSRVAKQIGYELLRKPNVSEAILKALQEKIEAKT